MAPDRMRIEAVAVEYPPAHKSTREMLQYISEWKSQPNATWRNKPKAMAAQVPEKGALRMGNGGAGKTDTLKVQRQKSFIWEKYFYI